MITINNYHDKIAAVNFSSLPEALRKGHEFVKKATDNGAHWNNYNSSDTIKKVIDAYFEKLSVHLDAAAKTATKKRRAVISVAKKEKRPAKGKTSSENAPSMVERIPEELRFIKRYVGLHEKTKTKDEVLRFINSLQKAILERRIRKTSVYASEIKMIQDKLIEVYNGMKDKITLILKPETLTKLKGVAFGEKVLPSVNFIKRYISLNGKVGTREKARLLLGQINKAYQKGIINDSDPYIVEMYDLKKNLNDFLEDKSIKALKIERSILSGLQGILNGCGCQPLNGLEAQPATARPTVMNSMDFAKLQFHTLGLHGKWRDLIGDPSTNFTIMVYGKPKMGKSYLCIDFAGYLARQHGKVLYVAKEEGLDKTLQDKLNDKAVKHPNLFVASSLLQSLAAYDFIFLDSVNKLGMAPEDLNRLKASYPQKAFIYIFQTTKEGKFRGANTFQHDVDSIIEVPERGKAVQFGRFNQGGEIQIFDDDLCIPE